MVRRKIDRRKIDRCRRDRRKIDSVREMRDNIIGEKRDNNGRR